MRKNKVRCFEPVSNQYYYLSEKDLSQKIDIFNNCLQNTGYVTFNEYLMILGLNTMSSGDWFGWSSVIFSKPINYELVPLVNSPYIFSVELDAEPTFNFLDY